MIHATEKYNHIQDPEKLIPDKEPVFLLRAQDKHAICAVLAWVASYEADPEHDVKRLREVLEHAVEMSKWPIKKTPS